MIRLRLAEVLSARGWTPYRLAQETGLTVPTAYRLADVSLRFGRFTADTLDRLCAALEVQPGDLLEWLPETAARRKTERAGATREGIARSRAAGATDAARVSGAPRATGATPGRKPITTSSKRAPAATNTRDA